MIQLSILLGAIGASELILIVVGALLLFGGKKIPELMKGVGQGMKEFKNALKEGKEGTDDINNSINKLEK
jgi:sec-independent protein translocase protein TatA